MVTSNGPPPLPTARYRSSRQRRARVRHRPSSVTDFPSSICLIITVTRERIEARWVHAVADYTVADSRARLEQGDVSNVQQRRMLADPYVGQLPQAFEAHLLCSMYTALLAAAHRHRGRGEAQYDVTVPLGLSGSA